MSMMLMVKAMGLKVGNPLRKLVLIKLADNANDKGECWPSYQHIADQCEIGKSTVRKHIKDLESAGLLRIEHREGPKGNSSNLYHLALDPVSPDSTGVSPDGTPPVSPDSTRTSHSLESVKEPILGSSEDKPTEKPAKQKKEYPPEFESLWSAKPNRQGGNPKASAFNAYNARLRSGAKHEDIKAGLERYKQYLKEQQQENTRYVMQMATFLGPDEHYNEPWTFNSPAKPEQQQRRINTL